MGVERNAPPPALLRRAAQMKSQSLDAGSSSFPPQSGSSHPPPPHGYLSTSASLDEKEKQELKEKKIPKTATITDSNQSVETSV